jgi:hypothetical protein
VRHRLVGVRIDDGHGAAAIGKFRSEQHTADVDFPAPPLGVRNTIVGMTDTTKFGMSGPENTLWVVEAQEDSESSLTVVRIPLDYG